MAVFPRSDSTRLAHVRALGGDFPFYGAIETVPAPAARDFRAGGRALVDESLLLQFHAQVGDPIKIGDVEFTIAGALQKDAGRSVGGGIVCAACLHSAARSRRDESPEDWAASRAIAIT